jgi:hypothetical protein
LLLVPVVVGCAAVAQAIAVNRASSLLPHSWTWANDSSVAWLLVLATTLVTVGLAWALQRAEHGEERRRDQRELTIRTDLAFQTTMEVHKPPSSRIRWTPSLDLFYSGARPLTILDIEPMAPPRLTEDDRSVQFVRTKVASSYKAYPTYGAVAQGKRGKADDDFHYVEQWPLLVQPGQRLHVAVEQEFELRLDGAPMSFGPYFDLEMIPGHSYKADMVLLPTRVVGAESAWDIDVPYLIAPVGSTLLVHSEEERAALIERDDLL